ncbi:C-X-C chemokine receptor type 6-like [Leptodactylus fuscus]|uniref:C-X-C chemokine receptor type 6-like n=1 Tax=Leptodactylus fuscus TaxID=238119 RepID=UPI003F4E80C3
MQISIVPVINVGVFWENGDWKDDNIYPEFFNDENQDQISNDDTLHRLFLPIAYSITCVLGLIGNALIIILFVGYEKIKTLTDTFLVNLAIADILFLLTLPFFAYQSAHSWIFGEPLCKIIRATYRVNLYTCMLTLTSITFDRFISITKVTKANKYQVTKQKWRFGFCALLWALALLLAIPQFLYSSSSHGNGTCFERHDSHSTELALVSVQMTVGFIFPLISMLFCYSFILKTLVKARGVQKRKSMKIIVVIVLVFIATQLPFNTIMLVLTLKKDLFFDTLFITVCTIMEVVAYIHPCLNPVLYFFVGTKFRKYFWKMLRALGRSKTPEETSDHLRTTDGDSRFVSASTNICATSV